MNATKKLLVLMVVGAAGYVAWLGPHGPWAGRGGQSAVFPDSLDATIFGASLAAVDDTGGAWASLQGLSLEGGRPSDPVSIESSGLDLQRLRQGCQAWMRRLGYDASAERESKPM